MKTEILEKTVDLDTEINEKIRKILKFKEENKFLNYGARNINIYDDKVKFTLEFKKYETIYASFPFYNLFIGNGVFYTEGRYIENLKERFSKYLDLVINKIENTLNKTQAEQEEQEEDLPF